MKRKKAPAGSNRAATRCTNPVEEAASVKLDAVPVSYATLLAEIKERVQQARLRAHLAASRELVILYWQIGRDIVSRQKQEGWGKAIIERLAADIQKEFPGMEPIPIRHFCHNPWQKLRPLPPHPRKP